MAYNFWDFDKDNELIGVFIGQYKSVGKFKKNVFCFKVGEKVAHCWSYVQLAQLLYGVPFQTEIKIRYLGMEKMPDSERMAKNFEIEILGGSNKVGGKDVPE